MQALALELRVARLATCLILFLPFDERPIESKPRCAARMGKVVLLRFSRLEFYFVGAVPVASLRCVHQLFVLFTATAVKPSAEHRSDFQHVFGQFFLKRGLFTFVDDDNFEFL